MFQIVLDPVESTTTQVLFQTLHHFLEDKDRFHVLSGTYRVHTSATVTIAIHKAA